MPLYQSSVLNKYLAAQDADQVSAAYQKYAAYFLNKEIQENIRNAKEEQFQQKFLMELFVNIFGYVMNPDAGYNLTTELKNIKDAKKTDRVDIPVMLTPRSVQLFGPTLSLNKQRKL